MYNLNMHLLHFRLLYSGSNTVALQFYNPMLSAISEFSDFNFVSWINYSFLIRILPVPHFSGLDYSKHVHTLYTVCAYCILRVLNLFFIRTFLCYSQPLKNFLQPKRKKYRIKLSICDY